MNKFETPIYQQSEEQEELFDICKVTMSEGVVIYGYFKQLLGQRPDVPCMTDYITLKTHMDEEYCIMFCDMMNNIDKKCVVLNVSTDQMKIVDMSGIFRGNYGENHIFLNEFMNRDSEIGLMKKITLEEYRYQESVR